MIEDLTAIGMGMLRLDDNGKGLHRGIKEHAGDRWTSCRAMSGRNDYPS